MAGRAGGILQNEVQNRDDGEEGRVHGEPIRPYK